MKNEITRMCLMAVVMLISGVAMAQIEIDGIYYRLGAPGFAYVTYPNTSYQKAYEGIITIPSTFMYGEGTYTVTQIGMDAFSYNSQVTGVNIPATVDQIGTRAFAYCSGLNSIFIPKSVTQIDLGNEAVGAFTRCLNLRNIDIDSENPKYDSRDGCNAIIDNSWNDGGVLVYGNAYTKIPSSISRIQSYAFAKCTNLDTLIIPEGPAKIGYGAFQECTGLTSVIIPNSITHIDRFAFSNCTNVQSLHLGSGLKEIYQSSFNNCEKIKNVRCDAETPPTVLYMTGYDWPAVFKEDTLHVYETSVDKYKSTWPWYNFKAIMAIGCKEMQDGENYNLTSNILFEQIAYTRTFSDTQWQPLYIPFSVPCSKWSEDFEFAQVDGFHHYCPVKVD